MTEESICSKPSPASGMGSTKRFDNRRVALCLAILLMPAIFIACRRSPATRSGVSETDQAFISADSSFSTTPSPSTFSLPSTMTPSVAPLSNEVPESTHPDLSNPTVSAGNQTEMPAVKPSEIVNTESVASADLDHSTADASITPTEVATTFVETPFVETPFVETSIVESTLAESTVVEVPAVEVTKTPIYVETPAAITPINELIAGTEEITIRGTVVQTASFSKGFKFEISDGTGTITLLLWQNIYDDLWEAESLNIGADVQVSGQVHLYEGELEIQPTFASQVNVLQPSTSTVLLVEIGSLDRRLGERVTVQGKIERVEGTAYGVKIFVADSSGEILVFIWNNILERIPNNNALGESGTSVRVAGIVQEYRSNREVVPTLPYDVKVLQD